MCRSLAQAELLELVLDQEEEAPHQAVEVPEAEAVHLVVHLQAALHENRCENTN